MTQPNNVYILIFDPQGNQLPNTGFEDLELTRTENAPGALKVVLPWAYYKNFRGDKRDYQIQVWRSVAGGKAQLQGETVWFTRKVSQEYDKGTYKCFVNCADAMDILNTRIVAYYTKTTQASKSGAADDLIKAIFNENFINPTDTSRSLSAYLSVQNSIAAAPVVAKDFSWKKCLDVIQEVAKASYTSGLWLGFDLVPTGTTLQNFEFRTYTTLRGTDRGLTSAQPVTLSVENGSIDAASIVEDYTDVASFIYCGGPGQESNRLVTNSSDAVRIGYSPYGRVEYFTDARNALSQASVQSEGDAELRARSLRRQFSCNVLDGGINLFDRDYLYGDIVAVNMFGSFFNCRVSAYNLKNDQVSLKLLSDG